MKGITQISAWYFQENATGVRWFSQQALWQLNHQYITIEDRWFRTRSMFRTTCRCTVSQNRISYRELSTWSKKDQSAWSKRNVYFYCNMIRIRWNFVVPVFIPPQVEVQRIRLSLYLKPVALYKTKQNKQTNKNLDNYLICISSQHRRLKTSQIEHTCINTINLTVAISNHSLNSTLTPYQP